MRGGYQVSQGWRWYTRIQQAAVRGYFDDWFYRVGNSVCWSLRRQAGPAVAFPRRLYSSGRSGVGRIDGRAWMCIQIRQILARVSVAFAGSPGGTMKMGRGRSVCLPASCLSTMTPCPFSPPPLTVRPALLPALSIFLFRFCPRRNATVFGVALRSSFNATRPVGVSFLSRVSSRVMPQTVASTCLINIVVSRG